jgi:hypothetical protein
VDVSGKAPGASVTVTPKITLAGLIGTVNILNSNAVLGKVAPEPTYRVEPAVMAAQPGATGIQSVFGTVHAMEFSLATLKPQYDVAAVPMQNLPGFPYYSETGFTPKANPAIGAADAGTGMQFSFSAPDNVKIFVPTLIGDGRALTAILTQSAISLTPLMPTDTASGFYQVPMVGGLGTVNYKVTSSNPYSLQDFRLRVRVDYDVANPPAQNITVTGGLSPSDSTTSIPRYTKNS